MTIRPPRDLHVHQRRCGTLDDDSSAVLVGVSLDKLAESIYATRAREHRSEAILVVTSRAHRHAVGLRAWPIDVPLPVLDVDLRLIALGISGPARASHFDGDVTVTENGWVVHLIDLAGASVTQWWDISYRTSHVLDVVAGVADQWCREQLANFQRRR